MKSLMLALLAGFTATVMASNLPWPNPSTVRTYVYNYVATSVSAVPGTSDNSTGIKMTMKVAITFTCKIQAVLQITQCTTEAFIGTYPEEEVFLFQEENTTDCNELQAQCLPFSSYGGHIVSIYPSVDEPIRILNIKRGILSAFQGMPFRKDGDYIEEQTDVLGQCQVRVQKSSTEDEVYLLKKRDTENCPNRPTEFSTVLPISKHQEAKFVFGETTAQMTFKHEGEYLILETSEVIEKQSFAPVSHDAGSATVTIRQVLSRDQTKTFLPQCTASSLHGSQTGLTFDFPVATCNPQITESCLPEPIIETMANLEDPIEVAEMFARLIEEMRKCSKRSLQELKSKYAKCQSPKDDKLRRKHTYFLDALAWLGTLPALDLISDLANNSEQCLNGSRRRELIISLTMVPLHRHCSPCKLLDVALEIAMNNKESMTPILVLGTVVRLVHKHPKFTCHTDKSINWLLQKYKATNDIEQKIHVLKAIGNTGSIRGISAIEDSLQMTVETTDEINFERRLAAIYALQHMARVAPSKISSIALDIYNNKSEDVEARIAAFLVYFRSPRIPIPTFEFLDVVKSLQEEPSPYVKSFVYTYLSGIETSDNPHTVDWKEAISYILRVANIHYWCKDCDLGYFSSKATHSYISLADADLPRSLPRDVMGIGLSTEFAYTSASSLPRSGVARLTVNAFGYDFDAIEVGVRAHGTDRLIERLFGPTGYLRLGTRILRQSGLPEQGKMCYPEQDPMWFAGYIKAFGNELAWNRADEGDINKALYTSGKANGLHEIITESVMSHFDFSDMRSIYGRLRDYLGYIFTGKLNIGHGDVCISKSATIVDLKRTVPTVIGLPLNLSALATVSTHMDVNGRMYIDGTTTLKAEGDIKPQAAVYANVTFVLDAGSIQPRLVHIGTVKTSFKQSARLTIDNDYTSSLYIDEMPSEPESVVFEAKYNQFVEVNGKTLEMGIWKRNETELYEHVGGNFTHVEFITPISYPNSTGVPGAPFFPLSGPAEAKLILRPVSPNPGAHHIKFWNNTELSTDRGTFYATFARGLEQTIDAIFDWYTVGEKPTQWRVVNLTATSVPAVASAVFQGNTSRRMDIEGWMSLNTSISNTQSYVKFNRSHFHGTATRKRIAPDDESVVIKIPEFTCEINGSLVNNRQGNVSAILYLEGSDKPQWLCANFTTSGLMVNITGESSKFRPTKMGYILPYPLKSPVCTHFDHHVITFDGLPYPIMSPNCEYILVRHRNESDNFAVLARNGGEHLDVYINGTKYTLTSWYLEINDIKTQMPYKVKHEIQIREVTVGSHKFIRLSAWVGLDIYFNGHGVHLSINGFYMNQTAGLCGNANGNGSREDEMVTPACQVVESVQDFVKSWAVGNSCLPSSMTEPPFAEGTLIEAKSSCDLLFTNAHSVIDYTPYLNACIHDVSSGHNPIQSLRAYIMAAASSQVAVEGCHYSHWSDWSGCSGNTKWQDRHRSVLANPLNLDCKQVKEERLCHTLQCDSYKDYIKLSGVKNCRSKSKQIQCGAGCKPVLGGDVILFYCNGKTHPTYLPYQMPLYCIRE